MSKLFLLKRSKLKRLLVCFLAGIHFVCWSVLNVSSKGLVLCWEDMFVKAYETKGSQQMGHGRMFDGPRLRNIDIEDVLQDEPIENMDCFWAHSLRIDSHSLPTDVCLLIGSHAWKGWEPLFYTNPLLQKTFSRIWIMFQNYCVGQVGL